MPSRERTAIVMVLVFTASAVIVLWGFTFYWQDQLKTEIFNWAELRGAQIAKVLAKKVVADQVLMDHALLGMRRQWGADPDTIKEHAEAVVASLPSGMASHIAIVDEDGKLVFSGLGEGAGANLDLSDAAHFIEMKTQGDHLVIGTPVASWAQSDQMFIPVGRPLYRDSRFAGGLFLMVSIEFMAKDLSQLALAKDDVVTLLHPAKKYLVRSQQSRVVVGQEASSDMPFWLAGTADQGVFRRAGSFDGVSRLYSWQRLPDTGLVVALGLSEQSVLAPLASTIERSRIQAWALTAILLMGGSIMAWLLARVESSANALRRTSNRLKDAQQMAKVGHWSIEPKTENVHWSEEVYRIFGQQPGLHKPTFDSFFNQVHPADLDRVTKEYGQPIKRNQPLVVMHRIVLGDGTVKHLRLTCVLEREDGQLVGGHGTVQDISELSAAQNELKHLNAELESRVADRTGELESLNEELEAFTYSVSHDLRTPLRSIHGFASLLEEESENLSPDGRAHLRRIRDSARRMGVLITDLLTMAQHSRAVAKLKRVKVSELALSVVSDVERADPSHQVRWQIDPDLEAVADPGMLRMVLQNLLGNAWKYSRQTPHPQVSLTCAGVSNGMVEFAVRDNGAGFDMAYVGQLFEPFKRLHSQHEFEGTGVGLASVYRLLKRQGGSVRAEGVVGKGAVFYFTLAQASEADELASRF